MIKAEWVLGREIEAKLNKMVQRERALQSYLNKNVLEQYRNIQRKRWMTSNTSEDPKGWDTLNADYAARKRRLYANYPGRGTKIMIRTNDLFQSVIGPGKGFRKITTPRSLIIATTIPYAEHANEARNFDRYSKKTWNELYRSVSEFIFKGILKQTTELL